MRIIATAVLMSVALAGCATKTYGRIGDLTRFERDTMNCREIALDRARTQGFIERVQTESRFSGKDALAFMGDFGIGNSMEKDAAMSSALSRSRQLDQLASEKKCAAS